MASLTVESASAVAGEGQPEKPQPKLDRVLWAFLGGILGGAFALFLRGGGIRFTPSEVKYEDLAAVLLAAVGVIVAVFGVVLAILAFWGFSQLRKDSIKAAVTAALSQVDRAVKQEIASPETERRIRERVDQVAMGRADKDRDLDTDPENLGGDGA